MDCRAIVVVGLLACVLGAQDQAGRVDSTPYQSDGAKGVDSNTLPLTEDRVEIIDYKHSRILGFMIVRDGNIIKRVIFKEPKPIGQDSSTKPAPSQSPANRSSASQPSARESTNPSKPTEPLASKPSTPAPKPMSTPEPKPAQRPAQAPSAQTIYERQVSNAPNDTKKVIKPSPKKSPSSNIAQEVGVESTRINPIYKNRQWDKSQITHDIQTEVIELER